MTQNKRLHFKDIDAMRFLAFVPIFLFCVFYLTRTDDEGFHSEITNLLGFVKQNSLDFFFFVSAFLLTSQGLREYKYNNSFSLRSFYMRRIFRILPLLIIGILFAFLIHPWILSTLKLNTIAAPSGSSYLQLLPNYFSELSQEQKIYLGVIWTIFMFIQFYIFWGIILKFFKNHIQTISISLIVIGIVARIIHHYFDFSFEFDTLSYGAPIGVGGILAGLIRNDSKYIEKIKLLPKKLIVPIYILGGLFVLFGYLISTNFILISFVPFFTCVFFSFAIVEQTFGKNSFGKLRNNKVFSHLGKASYGMILYQAILNVLLVIGIDSLDFDIQSETVKVVFLVISFAMTWIIADLSYNFYEKPLIRLRREFKKI